MLRKTLPRAASAAAATAAVLLLAACATGGKFGSFDDDGNGLVSAEEADGRIYYFNSYDKNQDGGLDEEEFKWAYAATKHRDDKKAGISGTPQRQGGGILGGQGGGGFGR